MRSHQQNLQTIQTNLEMFQGYAMANPSAWNCGRVVALSEALEDYKRHMAGEIERHEMCWTAIELTTEMPAWGTSGT